MKTTLEKINGFDVLHVEGTHTWDQARALPARVQGQHGITDWVLPDRMTLKALTGISEGIEGWHWSASPYVGSSNYAWLVSFRNGNVYDHHRNGSFQVRLVRASQCLGICAEAAKKSMAEAGIAVPEAQPAPAQLTPDQTVPIYRAAWAAFNDPRIRNLADQINNVVRVVIYGVEQAYCIATPPAAVAKVASHLDACQGTLEQARTAIAKTTGTA